MAKNTFADLDVTPANNSDLLNSNSTGSADANTIDTLVQNFAAMTARFYGDIGGLGTVGGSANAITLTSLSTYQTLESGLLVQFKAGSANSAAATLNLDGLGVKAIRRKGDTALSAGDIAANGRYDLVYDAAYNTASGAWVLMNPEGYVPAGTDVAIADGGTGGSTSAAAVLNLGLAGFFLNHLSGLTLANNGSDATNDIDIAVGTANDGGNTDVLVLASGLTKRLDAAWAVGTNQGGLDTGAIANTTYHMWLIKRPDTGVVDVLFSASASAPTMPANYTLKRRIGSIVRTGGAIKAFHQHGDDFFWDVIASDISANAPGTSAVTATLTLPTGITAKAMLFAGLVDGTPGSFNRILVSSLEQTDTAPSTSNLATAYAWDGGGAGAAGDGYAEVFTNTSAQVRYRLAVSAGDVTAYITTIGWVDGRGRA